MKIKRVLFNQFRKKEHFYARADIVVLARVHRFVCDRLYARVNASTTNKYIIRQAREAEA